jgi:energy-coupling factor transporter transmembrane protein EcfT
MGQYRSGFLYHYPIKAKGAMIALLLLGHFFSASLPISLMNATLVACLTFWGVGVGKLWPRLRPFLFFAAFIIFFHSLLNPANSIKYFWFGWEGFMYGSTVALRLLVIIMLAQSFLLTTDSTTIFSYFRSVNQDLGLIMFLLLGLLPVLQEEMVTTSQAQQARGLVWNNAWSKLKAYLAMIVPVIIKSLYRAQAMAQLLYLRGYEDKAQLKPGSYAFAPVLAEGYRLPVFTAAGLFIINITIFLTSRFGV